MSAVLDHVIAAIGEPSAAHAEAARARIAAAVGAPMLEALAARLGGAQHGRPRSARRAIVVVAGDHGCADPGIDRAAPPSGGAAPAGSRASVLGEAHPTWMAAQAIAGGETALSQLARSARASIVIVDAGAATALAPPAIGLGGRPSRDLLYEPAMTAAEAVAGIEAGIALAISLGEANGVVIPTERVPSLRADGPASAPDDNLDVIVLGALGLGSEVAAAALLGAVSRVAPSGLADDLAEQAGVLGAAYDGRDLVARFGGPETAVLAGIILAAASTNTAIILDSHATGAAALVAVALQPAVRGYLVAAHRGSTIHARILAHLGLTPVFDAGLGHGEGTGAAMTLPLCDQVAALSVAEYKKT